MINVKMNQVSFLQKSLIFTLTVLGVSTLFFSTLEQKKAVDKIVHVAQFPANYRDDRILSGASHNIFVGKVVSQIGKKERGIGPETQFEVEIIENIKGELSEKVVVNQQGGHDDKGRLHVMEGDYFTEGSEEESLLQIGSTYLFSTRFNERENWHTIISFPGANKVLTSNTSEKETLNAFARNDSRVRELREAYPEEILLDADIQNNKTFNSFSSLQTTREAIESEYSESLEVSSTTVTPPEIDDIKVDGGSTSSSDSSI